jgi:hypothetical protein
VVFAVSTSLTKHLSIKANFAVSYYSFAPN